MAAIPNQLNGLARRLVKDGFISNTAARGATETAFKKPGFRY